MPGLAGWSPYDSYVQGGMADGRYVSGAFTLLAAGPPRLAGIGGGGPAAQAASGDANVDFFSNSNTEFAMPIGVVQNLGLSHNRQFSRFWEVGSERSYFVSGRTMGQLSLMRLMYHGPSLLRMMYAYYSDMLPNSVQVPHLFGDGMTGNMFSQTANKHDVIIPPGYKNIFMNLASDLFSQPIGLLLYLKDNNEASMAAAYMEHCVIPSHSISTDSQGVVVQEQAQVQFERLVPIDVQAVALIKGIAADLEPHAPVPSGHLRSGGLGIVDSPPLV